MRPARQLLDRAAVEVPRREVHVRESRAGRQRRVDEAHPLEQLGPVHLGDQAHARDDVAHRDVRDAAALVLVVDGRVGRRPLRGEALVEPRQRGGDLRILVAQPQGELHGERLGQRGAPVFGEHHGHRFRGASPDTQQAVGDSVRLLPRGAAVHGSLGEAPEILDEHDAQRDRHRPELADRERLDLLVGLHVAAQHLGFEPAVRVGDEGPGQAEHARVPGKRAVGELRQLPVVAPRQGDRHLADVRFDQVVVVEQPLCRRGDRLSRVDRRGNVAMRRDQDGRVVGEPRRQRVAPRGLRRHRLRRREAPRVPFEAVDAEELLANGLSTVPRRSRGRTADGRANRGHAPAARCEAADVAGGALSVSRDARRTRSAMTSAMVGLLCLLPGWTRRAPRVHRIAGRKPGAHVRRSPRREALNRRTAMVTGGSSGRAMPGINAPVHPDRAPSELRFSRGGTCAGRAG